MATLLTNAKMDPALAARIEASLRRRAGNTGRDIYRPKFVAVARALAVIAILATVFMVYRTQRAARDKFEKRRSALIDAVNLHALSPSEQQMLPRAESAVKQLVSAQGAEFIDAELRAPAFQTLLGKPIVYVHGNVADFAGTRPVSVGTQETSKDALLYCLFDPPAARDEKTLLAKVLESRSAATLEQRTPNVTLLRDAEAGIPLLQPAWLEKVKNAKSGIELAQLELAFMQTPIENAKRAAGARYLLVALDEGMVANAFEGDRAHDVRVAIVDLSSSRLLLRLRKHVDPSFISAAHRMKHSIEIDQCAIAFDVRAAILP